MKKQPVRRKCSNCGSVYDENQKECPLCGSKGRTKIIGEADEMEEILAPKMKQKYIFRYKKGRFGLKKRSKHF